jgi:hypothetical protein
MAAVPAGLVALRPSRAVLLGTTAVFWAALALVVVGRSTLEFNTFNVFTPAPARIEWCNRFYDRDPTRYDAGVLPGVPASHRVGTTPSGRGVFSDACGSTFLWVQAGSRRFVDYAVEGGP